MRRRAMIWLNGLRQRIGRGGRARMKKKGIAAQFIVMQAFGEDWF